MKHIGVTGATGFFNMPFRKKVKVRLWFATAITMAGVIVFAVTWLGVFGDRINDEFVSGFYSGLGGGLIGAGVVTIIKARRMLRDPERFKAAEVEEKDERTIFVRDKTYVATTYIVMMTVIAALIVSMLFNTTVAMTLLGVLGVFGAAFIASYFVIKKRY